MKRICVCLLACFVLFCSSLITAQVAVTTYQNDNSRSGTNPHETTLTTTNVNVARFGRLAVFAVQGYVYAQPLYVPNLVIGGTSHNVLYVATEHDQVYAFDVNSGQQIWHTNFIAGVGPQLVASTVSSNDVHCPNLVPEIGITGTPVIDTASKTMYVSAETKVYNPINQTTIYYHIVHALDITTGLDKVSPRVVAARVQGTGTGSINGYISFNAFLELQRAALLLSNGQVYVTWASNCDNGSFHGWLISFNKTNLVETGAFLDTPNGYDGGIWGGGSGPAADANGAIYVATGNGRFSASSGGIDYGDSLLRLKSTPSGITVNDYFTPWDEQTLDQNDIDVGSGGLVLLPIQPGVRYPHLLLQAGKEGTIDLVNRDNMGHWHAGNDSQIVQTLPFIIGGLWGGPAFWSNTAYFGGQFDNLKAFAFNPATEHLSTSYTSESPEVYGYPGSTPAVSSNGTSNGIVWAIETDGAGGGYAVLRAYLASNLGTELYNSQQNASRDQAGLAVKFAAPTVADGHVFVGAQNQVDMYGLLQ
jgi:hypothetical protein